MSTKVTKFVLSTTKDEMSKRVKTGYLLHDWRSERPVFSLKSEIKEVESQEMAIRVLLHDKMFLSNF